MFVQQSTPGMTGADKGRLEGDLFSDHLSYSIRCHRHTPRRGSRVTDRVYRITPFKVARLGKPVNRKPAEFSLTSGRILDT